MRPDPSKMSPEALRVSNYDANIVAKIMEEKFPETWRRCSPKSIQSSDNYYSAKTLAIGFTGAIEEARQAYALGLPLDSNCAGVAGKMEQCDYPLYYVTRPLIEALLHSHPPKGQTWDDITLPFPALAFMLPRGTIQEPAEFGGRDLILLTICKIATNEVLPIPTLKPQVHSPYGPRTCVTWFLAPNGIVMQDATFPSAQPLEPSAEWIDKSTAWNEKQGYVHNGPAGDFASRVSGLVANLLLVMEARPEWIEPGRVVKRSLRADHPDIRTPTWIGKDYKVIRQDSIRGDARAHFTELGWRAGHFKRVRFGTNRAEVRTVFVEPYIAHTRGLRPIENISVT